MQVGVVIEVLAAGDGRSCPGAPPDCKCRRPPRPGEPPLAASASLAQHGAELDDETGAAMLISRPAFLAITTAFTALEICTNCGSGQR